MDAVKISHPGESGDNKNSKGLLVCVQVSDDVLREVQNVAEDAPIRSFAFLDQQKVEQLLPEARAVICMYDGPLGMARKLASAVRAHSPATPIFLIIPPQFQQDDIRAKKLKVSTAFRWPRDLARFAAAIYDLVHEENIIVEVAEQDRVSTFELSEIKRVESLEEISPPPRLSDQAVLESSRKEIERRKRNQKEMLELKELNPHYFIGRTLVFHPDPAGAEGLRRHLRSGGMPNSVASSSVSSAFHHLRGDNIACVVAWYDGENDHVIEFLNEVNAARTLRPVAVFVVVPGEIAMSKLAGQTEELIYDGAAFYDKSPGQFVKAIQSGINQHKSQDSLTGNLFKVRASCRHAIPGSKRKAIDSEELERLLFPLLATPGKTYWAEAEQVLQALLLGDQQMAAKLSAKLNKKKLDALILCALVKVGVEGGHEAGEWLVENALSHRQLNLERCYVIGQYLAKWNAVKPLEKLLLDWHNREDLPIEHQFYFIFSCYHELQKNSDMQFRFLSRAIKESPLRDEYLYRLLGYYQSKKDERRIEDVWRILLSTPGANPLAVRYHLARTLVRLKKVTEARSLLTAVLNVRPNFKPAQVLLKEMGDC